MRRAADGGVKRARVFELRLLALLASAEVRFNEELRSLPALRRVLDTLLLANLAEHEATNEELDMLEVGLQRIVARVLRCGSGGGGGVGPVLIARSEMYTPRRQLGDILARARRAVAMAMAAHLRRSGERA